ncbi:MAG: lamin tail domain-containing protein [Saprospiraceae bacterium]|nr:lamin tail domain-containing protein [Saprospiraceae bacterium]
MKKSFYIFLIVSFFSLVFGSFPLISQFNDNFSDGDININPEWRGNPENFITNNLYQLQLDAPDGGSSLLYTEYSAPDSFELGLYFKMDFSPSVSNKLRIYLMSDKTDISKANGYFIEIGENGSLDNLKFYLTVNGISSLLGSGNPGIFSDAPAAAFIRITKNGLGVWNFYTKINNNFFSQDFLIKDNQFNFSGSYFIIQCIYTSTRKDKFFFDDIYIKEYKPDKKAPSLTSISMTDKKTLELIFDEPIEETSIYNNGNYIIQSVNIFPEQILNDTLFPNKVILKYKDEFSGGRIYSMYVSGVEDFLGNTCLNSKADFYLIENAEKEDLIINEVLFNPFSDGSDFIEILNKSEKFINLKGLMISNSSTNKNVILKEDQILRKGDYACITSDPADIVVNYYVPDSIIFIETSMPALNDDKGNVSLIRLNSVSESIMIDSFDYNSDMHSDFLDDDEGISLERKNPLVRTNDRFNWTSCSTLAGGATPGFINSGYYELKIEEEGLFLTKRIFSPDDDGYEDELEIEYKLAEEGYLLNAVIYDSKGRFINQLVNNETLGKNGFITWDGFVDDKKVPVGIYILLFKIVGENGTSKGGKKPFVVAHKLK